MNIFKNITLLVFFSMIALPVVSMDGPLGKKYPTSFLGMMALHKKTKEYKQAQGERNCALQHHQNMLQQLKSLDIEHKAYLPLFKQTIVAVVGDKSLSTQSTDVLEASSPNSVANYSRTNTENKPLKSILKKSK